MKKTSICYFNNKDNPKYLSECKITYNSEEIEEYINRIKEKNLEGYYQIPNDNVYIEVKKTEYTWINNTTDLQEYLKSLKNSESLDLSEIIKLYECNNSIMRTPQTMITIFKFFELMTFEKIRDIQTTELLEFRENAISSGAIIDASKWTEIIKLGIKNSIALDYLGFNLDYRVNKQKELKKQ